MSGFSRLGWEYTNAEGQSVTVDLEKRDGKIHCSVQGQSIELPIEQVHQLQQALAQMVGTATGVALPIDPQTATSAAALPAVQPKSAPKREIDPNFPAKIRNGLLAMVGLVVVILVWDILANNRL